VRHQGEATKSQLGWHPEEPPLYTANLIENFIKKNGKDVKDGGVGKNPQKKSKKARKKHKHKNS